MANAQAPTLVVTGTGATTHDFTGSYYGDHGGTSFSISAAHPAAPAADNFNVTGSFSSTTAAISIHGFTVFGQTAFSGCPYSLCTWVYGAGATLNISLQGTPGTQYSIDITRTASMSTATGDPIGIYSASADSTTANTNTGPASASFSTTSTVQGTGSIATSVSLGGTVGFRQAYCIHSDAEGCFGDSVYPGGGSAQVDYTIQIVVRGFGSRSLSLSCPANNGTVNAPYGSAFVASGGTGGFNSYGIATGSLPSGLDLDSAGGVSGTPTTAGTFAFVGSVMDSSGAIATSPPCTIVIAPTGSGGTIQVTTNLSAATFTISGPATYLGNGTTFTEANAPPGAYTIAFGAVFGYSTPSPQTQTLLAGGSITFAGAYQASGGTIQVTTNLAAATFSIAGPANYAGSGTSFSQPNAPAGAYTITFGSVNGYVTPSPQSQTLSIGGTITFSGTYQVIPPLSLACPSSSGTVSVPYASGFTASGGSGTYTSFTLASGSLPAGLLLTSGGGITGTPLQIGSSSFTGRVTDSTGGSADSITCAISIAPPPPQISVVPGAISFGSIDSQQTGSRLFMISNIGPPGSVLTGTTLPPSLPFSITNGGGSFSLGAGETEAVTVSFQPTSTGTFTDSILITSNDPSTPSLTVLLSGSSDALRTVTVWINAFIPYPSFGPLALLPQNFLLLDPGVTLSLSLIDAAGDGRSFSSDIVTSYRVQWAQSFDVAHFSPTCAPLCLGNVGDSHLLNASTGTIIASARPDNSGVIVGQPQRIGSYVYIHMTGGARFGFLDTSILGGLIPAINVDATFRIDLAHRTCQLVGSYGGFPAFEAYIQGNTDQPTSLLQSDVGPEIAWPVLIQGLYSPNANIVSGTPIHF